MKISKRVSELRNFYSGISEGRLNLLSWSLGWSKCWPTDGWSIR